MGHCKIAWLLDDYILANFLTEHILKQNDFATEIITFTEVKSALSYIDEVLNEGGYRFPDYIFLDVNMPELNGWDFPDAYAKIPDEHKKKCCLYMLSSSMDKEEILKAEQHEDTKGFITKPLTAAELTKITSGK